MKNKTFSFLASIFLLSFASCTDEVQELGYEQSQTLKQIVMTTQDFQPEADSRTVFQIADGTVTCIWAVNDTVGVIPNEGMQTSFPMDTGAGMKNATFDGGGWALKDGNIYAAYSPFIGDMYLDSKAVPVTYVGQTQVGNASMKHLGAYDYMVATPTIPEFGVAKFTFKHLSAFVQLKLTISQPTSLRSMKLIAETESLAMKGNVDIMAATPVITPVTSSKEIELKLQNVVTTEEDQVVTLYLMLPPVDLSTQTLQAIVTTDNGIEEIPLKSRNFKAGMAYGLSGMSEDNDIIGNGTYMDGIVSIAEAGTMKKLLGSDYLNITFLKVVGPLNGDDIYYLRQMLGGDNFSQNNRGRLKTLDLSKASIVEGGGWYYDRSTYYQGNSYYTVNGQIGDYMFHKCINLESIVLPRTTTLVGNSAFEGCIRLTSANIPKKVEEIGNAAFKDCEKMTSVSLGVNCVKIGKYAFKGCVLLTSAIIPEKVVSIGSGIFENCSSLISVTLPADITYLGNSSFNGCSSLAELIIPDNVVMMGDSIFYKCSSLKSSVIPHGVTTISPYAFYGCSSLSSISLPEGLTSIGEYAFRLCKSLDKIVFPESLTKIEAYAFSASDLWDVIVPDNVTTLGEYAFADCSGLHFMEIGDGVKTIPRGAFINAPLNKLVLGEKVNYISYNAFHDGNCYAYSLPLNEVHCYSTQPPQCEVVRGQANFSNLYYSAFFLASDPEKESAINYVVSSAAKLYVPMRCTTAYTNWDAIAWHVFKNNIFEMD